MPVVKTHKRWWLGPNDYLDVGRNNTDREVIFTLGYREKDSRVTERASWTMNLAEGFELAKFLANVTTMSPQLPDPDEEDTDPGIRPRGPGSSDPPSR